jgi:hypothetical protein
VTQGYIWVPLTNASGPGVNTLDDPSPALGGTTVTYSGEEASIMGLWYVPGCVTEVTVVSVASLGGDSHTYGFFCG